VLMTRVESPSRIVLVVLWQLRILRPSSRDSNSIALLVEFPILPAYKRIMLPPLSPITPPIPIIPGFPFSTPSKFNMRNPAEGGVQLRSSIWSCGGRPTCVLLHLSFRLKCSKMRESWPMSCAFPVWQLRLYTISHICEIIDSLSFPSGRISFLKICQLLYFHISHMIILDMRFQNRFTISFSL
jgi:hypothetical protein